MNDEQIIEAIEKAIDTGLSKAVDAKLKDFFVDREVHYKHHQFLGGLIDVLNKVKGTAVKTITYVVVMTFLALLILGFIFWGKGKF